MGKFQLILLDNIKRPIRAERPLGTFSLVQLPYEARVMTSPEQNLAQTPDAAALWLLPGDALARVREVISDYATAINTIVDRLKVGLVKATYETLAWENTSRRHAIQQKFIPQNYWKHYASSGASHRIWNTSDLRLFLGSVDGSLTENNAYLTFFQVRLGKDGIDAIIANAPKPRRSAWIKKKPEPEAPAPPKIEDPEPEIKKPAVPPAYLAAWFEFYKKVGGEMREDPAWDHARMCFPKNSITRQKIRDLLPERPMGRPKTRET